MPHPKRVVDFFLTKQAKHPSASTNPVINQGVKSALTRLVYVPKVLAVLLLNLEEVEYFR
jgi:hypothetical protein